MIVFILLDSAGIGVQALNGTIAEATTAIRSHVN